MIGANPVDFVGQRRRGLQRRLDQLPVLAAGGHPRLGRHPERPEPISLVAVPGSCV